MEVSLVPRIEEREGIGEAGLVWNEIGREGFPKSSAGLYGSFGISAIQGGP